MIATIALAVLMMLAAVAWPADGIQQAADTARSGVRSARIAVDLAAQNIANAETTQLTPQGGPYQRQFPLLRSDGYGVAVAGIVKDTKNPIWVYDPAHPHANAQGFVAKPNIDLAEELLRMNYYSNWLEANAAVIRRCKQMNDAVLELTR